MRGISIAVIACALGCVVHSAAAGAATEKVLLSFSGTNGQNPYAGLIDVNGMLYGTTFAGGGPNDGTVFALDLKTHAMTLLIPFANDGNPYAGFVNVNGALYGTTYGSGGGNGTVFSFNTRDDAETVLFSFGSSEGGANPYAGLIHANGMLYGSTYDGGAANTGTLFTLDPRTGTETVLYSFGGATDGANPTANLLDVKGMLYGTTSEGGAYGYGTLFAFNSKTGTQTALYSFGSGKSGRNPYAGLIAVKGTLYGTTEAGGAYGYGTVFAFNLKSGATVLHSFGNNSDGRNPYAALLDVGGTLYGTTYAGGSNGKGTVFSLDAKTNAETVLHSFGSGTDGANPYAGLINVGHKLYGTTYAGGGYGDGTIFSIVP